MLASLLEPAETLVQKAYLLSGSDCPVLQYQNCFLPRCRNRHDNNSRLGLNVVASCPYSSHGTVNQRKRAGCISDSTLIRSEDAMCMILKQPRCRCTVVRYRIIDTVIPGTSPLAAVGGEAC
ncbi:hypothetical protein IG631_22065 [Alternaria alternata]|nr:hypothetical protein IG631_22065 [Alternaria alternata]